MAVHREVTTEWQFVGVFVLVTEAERDQVNLLGDRGVEARRACVGVRRLTSADDHRTDEVCGFRMESGVVWEYRSNVTAMAEWPAFLHDLGMHSLGKSDGRPGVTVERLWIEAGNTAEEYLGPLTSTPPLIRRRSYTSRAIASPMLYRATSTATESGTTRPPISVVS